MRTFKSCSFETFVHGQFLIHVTIGTTICCIYLSIYTALAKRNHSVTMVLPTMVERLRNRPIVNSLDRQRGSLMTTKITLNTIMK